jgi:L-rhamnose mutarotase
MTRYGSVLRLQAEAIAMYKTYHAGVWPEVLATIRECQIRHYTIFLKDDLLFGYFEYHGSDYAEAWPKWQPTRRRKHGGRS